MIKVKREMERVGEMEERLEDQVSPHHHLQPLTTGTGREWATSPINDDGDSTVAVTITIPSRTRWLTCHRPPPLPTRVSTPLPLHLPATSPAVYDDNDVVVVVILTVYPRTG